VVVVTLSRGGDLHYDGFNGLSVIPLAGGRYS
jgi:hypothetical protein